MAEFEAVGNGFAEATQEDGNLSAFGDEYKPGVTTERSLNEEDSLTPETQSGCFVGSLQTSSRRPSIRVETVDSDEESSHAGNVNKRTSGVRFATSVITEPQERARSNRATAHTPQMANQNPSRTTGNVQATNQSTTQGESSLCTSKRERGFTTDTPGGERGSSLIQEEEETVYYGLSNQDRFPRLESVYESYVNAIWARWVLKRCFHRFKEAIAWFLSEREKFYREQDARAQVNRVAREIRHPDVPTERERVITRERADTVTDDFVEDIEVIAPPRLPPVWAE
ncbi:hypothetical protein ACA910_017340 [Epithemia clementina (nom. ined.)]